MLDMSGRIRSVSTQAKGTEFRIERNNLPAGIYLVEIDDGQEKIIIKLMLAEM